MTASYSQLIGWIEYTSPPDAPQAIGDERQEDLRCLLGNGSIPDASFSPLGKKRDLFLTPDRPTVEILRADLPRLKRELQDAFRQLTRQVEQARPT